ncbi:H-NS family histone-like protein [Budvicia aquatica]|uniref:Global DNA-binding transcriptional dual regulator H-NS n=1 Tax=Budvicia aquatica TaxID=82979 RepID=A0A2C6DSB7_9GAMM|nr:hypothetical protein [Budvicia aquatica]PHI31714.1 hypothetical protein CRN84_21475 [Budvicia aquatica]VFS52537.1 global DNA-binding transcriptional dual regulator H-NS [Budvicia aquatica]
MTNDERKRLERAKKKSKKNNLTILNAHDIEYKHFANQSIVIDTANGAVCFYPTTNKIQYRGKVCIGDATQLVILLSVLSDFSRLPEVTRHLPLALQEDFIEKLHDVIAERRSEAQCTRAEPTAREQRIEMICQMLLKDGIDPTEL